MNVYDISDLKKIDGDNMNDKIKNVIDKYGYLIKIKIDDHIFSLIFDDNELIVNGLQFYRFECYDEKIKNLLFVVDFYDLRDINKKNHCYIHDLFATSQIRGKEIVKTFLKILKELKVKKAFLHDDAHVNCHEYENRLSFLKVLQRGTGFYQDFGFELIPNNMEASLYNTPDKLKEKINELSDSIKKIKTNEVLIFLQSCKNLILKSINDLKMDDLRLIARKGYYYTKLYEYYISSFSIYKFLENILEMITSIQNLKEEYLYEVLIKFFNDPEDCIKYNLFYSFFTSRYLGIKYGDTKFVQYWNSDFSLLTSILAMGYYCYTFD